MTVKNALCVGASIFFVVTTTLSCTNYRYGVLLWPTQEITDGINSVYRVRSVDTLNNTATFLSDSGMRVTLEQWRLSIFDNKDDATAFQEQYETWKHIYARCEFRALPIRSEQNRFSDIVYRLQEGEIIKIIDRADEQTDEAGFQDYWYEVVTKSGQRGWVFGYYLSLIDETVDSGLGASQGASQITFFLNNVWRPVSFQYMADTGYIDTDVFKREYGLFSFPLERLITINTQDHLIHFTYNSSEILSNGDLLFVGENSQIGVQFVNPQQIDIDYNDSNGGTIVESFSLFDADIEQIRNQAVAELRSQLFDILSVSSRFRISGNEWLIIRSDGTFSASVQQINIPNTGSLVFSLYLNPSLSQQYDGVIGFFEPTSTTTTHFAYKLSQRSMSLSLIGEVGGVLVHARHLIEGAEVGFTAY